MMMIILIIMIMMIIINNNNHNNDDDNNNNDGNIDSIYWKYFTFNKECTSHGHLSTSSLLFLLSSDIMDTNCQYHKPSIL